MILRFAKGKKRSWGEFLHPWNLTWNLKRSPTGKDDFEVCKRKARSRWWFQRFFYVHPYYLGKMNPFWRAYFPDGLVQPPTRRRGGPVIFLGFPNHEKTWECVNPWWLERSGMPQQWQRLRLGSPKKVSTLDPDGYWEGIQCPQVTSIKLAPGLKLDILCLPLFGVRVSIWRTYFFKMSWISQYQEVAGLVVRTLYPRLPPHDWDYRLGTDGNYANLKYQATIGWLITRWYLGNWSKIDNHTF